MLDSPTERESVLRRNRHWFDVEADKVDEIIAEIASADDPYVRMAAALRWQELSAAVFYRNLLRKFRGRKPFKLDELMPPDPTSILHYLRLDDLSKPSGKFSEAIDVAAATVIRQEGIPEAIDRLSGLPVPVPRSLLRAIKDLDESECKDVIRRWLRAAGPPLSKIHLIYVLAEIGGSRPAYTRLARRLVRQLILPSAHENLAAFLAILSWVTDQVGHSPKATGWRVELRLAVAWTHSNRLFTLLRSAGAKPEWIERLFSQPIYGLRTEMFEHDVTGYYDIAHPRNVSSEKLLMSGLSYAVSGKEGQILTVSAGIHAPCPPSRETVNTAVSS